MFIIIRLTFIVVRFCPVLWALCNWFGWQK